MENPDRKLDVVLSAAIWICIVGLALLCLMLAIVFIGAPGPILDEPWIPPESG